MAFAGLTPVVTLVGTPAWANSGRSANFAPPRPRDIRRFATAAARRYPWVRHWLIWNEPNKRLWLRPTRPAIYVRHVLNPAYEGIHAVLPHAQVGGGVTGPRGAAGEIAPVAWVRSMALARAKFDAYAHHPYPLMPSETPSSGGCRDCPSITMATIRKLLILVRRSFGDDLADRVRLPDEAAGQLGVPQAAGDAAQPRRDASVEAAAGHDVDPVPLPRRGRPQPLQTGLVFADNRWKPSRQGFRLPFAQMGRKGVRAVVWGQIRGGRAGRKQYRLEVLRKNEWKPVGRVRLTNDHGVFIRTIRLKRGALLRIWSPRRNASACNCGSGELRGVHSPDELAG